MSLIEKAGSAVMERSSAAPAKQTAPEQEERIAALHQFRLDYDRLAAQGLYSPLAQSSQFAMELRAVKRRLLRRIGFLRNSSERQPYRTPGRQKNIILVTSSCAGEGKTFSAMNLALSFAIEDKIETLLIDADAPRPKIRKRLGLPSGKGLTDLLMDRLQDPQHCLYRASGAPLSVLSEGMAVDRSAELFAGDACESLLASLSTAFRDRLVIIDAPPVLAATEAVLLSKYVDEIVFVVEANATPEPAVASAIDELLDVNPNVSLMLNRCLIGAGGSHYGSYEYYGPGLSANDDRSSGRNAEDASDGER